MIAIVDCRLGNLKSILNMLRRIGAPAALTSDADQIRAADKLILPGVGAFDHGLRQIAAFGLTEVLHERVHRGVPVLGICLGMQLLTRRSEEGELPGLGWLAGETRRLPERSGEVCVRVPHMGWNEVEITPREPLFAGLEDDPDTAFYFVHSYRVVPDEERDVAAWCRHGVRFAAAVRRGNVMGTQFHPEKSHRFGLRLLRNFAELT